VVIEGYVNSAGAGTMRLSARDEFNLLTYALPVVIGGLALVLGRLTCGAVPRSSGAKGMFVFSGLFTLVALVGAVAATGANKLHFADVHKYALAGCLIALGVAEVLFLLGLAVSGSVLKRPWAARAAGLVVLVAGLVAALAAAAVTTEWDLLAVKKKIEVVKAEPAGKEDADAPKGPPPGGAKGQQPGKGKKGAPFTPPEPPTPLAGKDKDQEKDKEQEKQAETGVKKSTGTEEYTAVLRQVKRTGDEALYESAGGMLAWLLLIGTYWRSVGATRQAIRDHLDQLEGE
jgi:hypothetical protein